MRHLLLLTLFTLSFTATACDDESTAKPTDVMADQTQTDQVDDSTSDATSADVTNNDQADGTEEADDGTGTDQAGDGTVDVPAVCDVFAAAVCDMLDGCAHIFIAMSFGDAAVCGARLSGPCERSLAAPGASLSQAKLDACLAAVNSMGCETFFADNLPAECDLAGTLVDGAPCGDGAQCQSSFCAGGGDFSCGTCALRPQAGQPCAGGKCDRGLVCNDADTCVVPAGAGDACTAATPCASLLSCVGTGGTGICANAAAVGEPCDEAEETAPNCSFLSGLFCNGNTHVCATLGVGALGEPCGLVNGSLTVCAASYCQMGAGPTGTCAASLADGAVCTEGSGPSCSPPAECMAGHCTFPEPITCE